MADRLRTGQAGGVDFWFSVAPGQLAELRRFTNPKQFRGAIFQAVKRTTTKAARILQVEVQKHAFISNKYIKRAVFTRLPSGDPPEGKITVSQRLIPSVAFKYTASKSGGVTIKFGPDRPALHLRHAFMATVRTAGNAGEEHAGHKGIFLRARHLPTKGPNVGKYKLTPRGFAARFAITEQFGPSVLNLVQISYIWSEIHDQVEADLLANMDGQLSRFMKIPIAQVRAARTGGE